MMDKFLQAITALKLPSLILLGLFFWSGTQLLIDAQATNAQYYLGFALLIIAGVLGVIFLVDYRYREHTEHIMQRQERAIDNLSKALDTVRKTHDMGEKNKQETMTGTPTGEKTVGGTYTVKEDGDTEVTL